MKKTYPIKWHEECLKNRMRTAEETKKRAAELNAKVASDALDIAFYALHIESAKKENKPEFDSDRYLIKQKFH